jgi:hypothetical protein
MSCVLYNIIKEGFLDNLTTAPVTKLTEVQIIALYDDSPTTPAATISGAATVGLLAEFGESYDVCYMDYHTDETVSSNISVKYGTTSGTNQTASVALHTAGVYRATISGIATHIELRHTLTAVATDINQLEVIAVKNETLGFGTSVVDQTERVRLEHATIGVLSATANEIPLFNDNSSEQVVRVAVAPTFTEADNYLHLATEEDGPYYGIDDFGFQQPGPDPILLVDDPMLSAEELHPQWRRRQGYNENTITPTAEGVIVDAGFDSGADFSSAFNVTCVGLLTEEYFAPHSFTAEVEIRFLGITGDFNSRNRPIWFALTNGFYIDDIGFYQAFQTDGRVGSSTGGVGLNGGANATDKDTFRFSFRYMDGLQSDNAFSQGGGTGHERNWNFVDGNTAVYRETLAGPDMTGMEETLNETLNDFTESSEWHTWRLVYDHVKQELTGYSDKLKLGSHVFRTDAFKSGCKLFIGTNLENGHKFALRNFKIYHDKIYRQKNVAASAYGGTVSATISGVESNTQYLIDGDESTVYVGPHPDNLAKIRIDFDQEYDIVNYTLQQLHTTAFLGNTPDRFGVNNWFADTIITSSVDYGGINSYTNTYTPNIYDSNDIRPATRRSPTFSGSAVTVSGVGYVEWQFVDYDRTTNPNNALVIQQLEVYAEEWTDALILSEEVDPTKVRWFEGRWRNLRQYGTSGALALKDPRHVESAYWPTPEYLLDGVDYGTSSAEYRSQTGNGTVYNPFTETLFSSPNNTHSNEFVFWYSEVQVQPEPFYIWRQFAEEIELTVISTHCNTFVNKTVPKEFKYQYLKEGGDPNTEEGWADIPPMTQEYVQQSNDTADAALRYNEYKKYKIANNDGEYYTGNNLQVDATAGDPGGVGIFQLGIGGNSTYKVLTDKVPADYRDLDVVYNADGGNLKKSTLIVELDAPIRTRGVRLVVKNPVVISSTNAEAARFSLYEFQAWGLSGNGSYTSPVFDTGTAQNTERLVVDTLTSATTAADVYVRSSALPPTQAYDTRFENWEPLGALGQPGFSISTTDSRDRAISIGDETHFLLAAPYVYNHVTDTWSQPHGGYPAQAAGGPSASDTFDTADLGSGIAATIRPDPSVDDRAALVDGVIYLAVEETANTGADRLIELDLNQDNPFWRLVGGTRPAATTNATMCAYDRKLYFFNEDGPIFYWDLDTSNWVLADATLPLFGGDRARVTSVLYKDKIYLFGTDDGFTDTPRSHEVSIFDPKTETFTSGQSSPRSMQQVQPVLAEDGVIYALSKIPLKSHQRYYPDEDRWEVVSSLSWKKQYHDSPMTGYFYFIRDGYIYAVYQANEGLARTLVRKPIWEHGKMPDFRDPVWGSTNTFAGLPWKKIDSFGELMPQERYFQFKVEMHSYDWVESPVLREVKIVIPQPVTIPASGTSSVYLKVAASEEGDYKLWYAGRAWPSLPSSNTVLVDDTTILYASSARPDSWGLPVTASGFYEYKKNNFFFDAIAPRSPWVLPVGDGTYDFWYVATNAGGTTLLPYYNLVGTIGYVPLDINGSEIFYVNTSDPHNMTADNSSQKVIESDLVGGQSGSGYLVWHPTVVAHSPTNLKMWFTEQKADEAYLPSFVAVPATYQRIIYAESTDKVTWTNRQIVIDVGEDFAFGYDALASYRPCVLFENNVYRMWYTGVDSSETHRILYRESTDGITWGTVQLSVDIASQGYDDLFGASRPHVLFDVSGYIMYYFGYDGTSYVVIKAESADGLDWVNFTTIMSGYGIDGTLDSEGIVDFFVLVDKDTVTPGTVTTSGKLKIHNEGSGL